MTNPMHPVHEPKVRALESDIEVHKAPEPTEFEPLPEADNSEKVSKPKRTNTKPDDG